MKNVIYTIDVEGHKGEHPFERLVWGRTNSGEVYGIDRIMDIADSYGIICLFFVDFAAAWDYGEEVVSDVVHHIIDRGHNVGVHLHPDHMADRSRPFLWEYSYEEQKILIEKCTKLYLKIVGQKPLSFRAGKYGANRETLDILSELGYQFDFSQFYGQKWCKIYPPVGFNVPVKYKNILEIPVTSFLSFKLLGYQRWDRVDSALYKTEFRYAMRSIAHSPFPIIVSMFSHSFSFLKWRDRPDNPVFNPKEELKTIENIRYLCQSKNFKFISEQDLLGIDRDTIPYHDKIIDLSKNLILSSLFVLQLAYSIRRENRKANLLIKFLSGVFIVSSIIIFFLFIRG